MIENHPRKLCNCNYFENISAKVPIIAFLCQFFVTSSARFSSLENIWGKSAIIAKSKIKIALLLDFSFDPFSLNIWLSMRKEECTSFSLLLVVICLYWLSSLVVIVIIDDCYCYYWWSLALQAEGGAECKANTEGHTTQGKKMHNSYKYTLNLGYII